MDELGKHGGEIYSYMEIIETKPLDYSANINPLGLPENVKKALANSIDDFCDYPDIKCRRLKEAVSIYENFVPEGILFGNGAADIIFRICYALRPKFALLIEPTFSEYEQALLNAGCSVGYFHLRHDNNFALEEDILESAAGKNIVFICNPNNPTGNLADRGLMYKLAERCMKEKCIMVIDECFMDFVREKGNYSFTDYLSEFKNVIIIKAFTKTFAMAGLRLGYCLCMNKKLMLKLEKIAQPWSVSTPAQIAGIAALNDKNYLIRTVEIIDKEREYLIKSLKGFGFIVFKSCTNFILFKTKQKNLYNMLYKKGVLIRKCGNFKGLDETYYRIAIRCREDNERLICLISEVIGDGKGNNDTGDNV